MNRINFVFLAMSLFGGIAHSAEVQHPSVPRSFVDDSTGFSGRVLGYSCFAFDGLSSGLPCNPAHVAKDKPSRLFGSFFWGNNITYANEATQLVAGTASEESVRSLFSRNESSELETHLEVGGQTSTFGASITPYELKYFSVFGNQSLPETQLVVIQESSAKIQLASYVGHDTYVGLQTRLAHRKYLNSQFFLTDLIAEGRDQYIETSTQSALYLEPGLVHSPENSDWNPEYSIALKNWGFTTAAKNPLPVNSAIHISAAINPHMKASKYGLGVDLFWDKEVRSFPETITLGSYYEFGILRLLGSLAQRSSAIGFIVNHRAMNVGLSFINQSYTNPFEKEVSQNRIYAEAGFEL